MRGSNASIRAQSSAQTWTCFSSATVSRAKSHQSKHPSASSEKPHNICFSKKCKLHRGCSVPALPEQNHLVSTCSFSGLCKRTEGKAGCRVPRMRYLWVLGSSRLANQAGQQGWCARGELRSTLRQLNAHFTAKETEKQSRSLSQRESAWAGNGKGAAGAFGALGHFHLFLFRFALQQTENSGVFKSPVACPVG